MSRTTITIECESLDVDYILLPGAPQTLTDPADPDDIELTGVYVAPFKTVNILEDLVGTPYLLVLYNLVLESLDGCKRILELPR